MGIDRRSLAICLVEGHILSAYGGIHSEASFNLSYHLRFALISLISSFCLSIEIRWLSGQPVILELSESLTDGIFLVYNKKQSSAFLPRYNHRMV
jgi:hypothetical protein